MKSDQIRHCGLCGHDLRISGSTLFWVITIKHLAMTKQKTVDDDAAVLAENPGDLFVCSPCAQIHEHPVMVLAEIMRRREAERLEAALTHQQEPTPGD